VTAVNGYPPTVKPGGADFPAVPLVRTDLAEPTVADRYELRSVLGSGGMGTVWEAYDIRLGRTVALKVLRDDLPPSAALQLEREARAAARILDPRVVTVLDLAHTADGNPYLVLECHDGHTLADELGDGPLVPERLDRLVDDLLGALGSAHRCGVLHRDVKPSNVLAGEDGFRVTDFGLASLDDDQTTETDIMGTLVYVAPERLDGARGSTRSDVFSAAVVIHEAATGVQPFRREQAVESIAALRTGDAPTLPDTLPEALRDALRRALSPDPGDRPLDAGAMLAQIRSGAGAPPLPADPTIRLDATSVLPKPDPGEATVPVPEVDDSAPPPAPVVAPASDPAAERTVTVPHEPVSPTDATTEAPSYEQPLAPPPAPRSPGPFDGVSRFVGRHGRRPEVLIGLIAALILLLLLLVVALDRGDSTDPSVVDTGQDAPASLDETLDRIEELGR
jgi:eukaryotic-like serine/threonine-protein kinase